MNINDFDKEPTDENCTFDLKKEAERILLSHKASFMLNFLSNQPWYTSRRVEDVVRDAAGAWDKLVASGHIDGLMDEITEKLRERHDHHQMREMIEKALVNGGVIVPDQEGRLKFQALDSPDQDISDEAPVVQETKKRKPRKFDA